LRDVVWVHFLLFSFAFCTFVTTDPYSTFSEPSTPTHAAEIKSSITKAVRFFVTLHQKRTSKQF
jgi:hypothetical protein